MSRPLYSVWKEEEEQAHPWKAQLVNYVGNFATEALANSYAAYAKKHAAETTTENRVAAAKKKQ